MAYVEQVRKDNTTYEITPLSTAPRYNASNTYDVGDYCYYDGILYRCKTAITTAEAWTASHWDATTVNEELKGIYDGIDDIVIISEQQPSVETNKIWIEDNDDYIEIPTMDDLDELSEDITELQTGKADIIITSASDTVASFPDGAEYDAVGLTAEFAPYQEGTGDPSPENIHPIHGWTGLGIGVTGENLFDKAYASDADNYTNSGSYGYMYTDPVYLCPNTKYTIKATNPSVVIPAAYLIVKAFSSDDISLGGAGTSRSLLNGVSGTSNAAVTTNVMQITTGNTGAIRFAVNKQNYADYQSALDAIFEASDFQINLGSTATPYAPSVPIETTHISWQTEAGEVYGGYVDVVRGKLIQTWGILSVSSSNTTVRTNTITYPYQMRTYISGIKLGANVLYISDTLPSVSLNTEGLISGAWRASNTQEVMYWVHPDCATEEGANTLRNSGIQFAYEIAQPIEYDITPATIKLLLGYNNVWTNAGGNVDVIYKADTKLYIDGKQVDIRSTIAPIEDGDTASQAYATGKFFYRNGSFCKAKTAIASGAAFTLGTNYEVTTVSAELFTALS